VTGHEHRLRGLVEAGIALSSELELASVLQRLVETAAGITGARYAALGVIDPAGRGLEQFVAAGLTPDEQAAIGELPRGRGILGVLIREAKPLRLHDLTEDPRSVGFPPGHPEMRTFLGVPIVLRGVAYGNLYLAEKAGGADFTEDDEDLVTLLAAQAAVAIENARLYESATRWGKQLETLNEIGDALVSETDLPRLLDLISRRLRELVGAKLVAIVLPAADGTVRFEAADGEGIEYLIDKTMELNWSKAGHVLQRKRTERVDSMMDDPEVNQRIVRPLGSRTGLFVPMVVRDEAIGVIVLHDKQGGDPRFTSEDVRVAEAFADRAAVAVDLSRRVARDSLRRVLAAQELERRRLALELHDQTGQALTSVLLGLRAVEEARSPEELRQSTSALRDLVVGTLQDVRRLAVELRPKALDDFGLVPALERLTAGFAEQTGIVVQLEPRLPPDRRLPSEVETALYRIVQESLTNVVKHARATSVSILLTAREGWVTAVIEDDGRGFAREGDAETEGLGLVGMRERVALLDGRLGIETSEGAGTTIKVEVPLL
jgi:signal transduction histidine kinase